MAIFGGFETTRSETRDEIRVVAASVVNSSSCRLEGKSAEGKFAIQINLGWMEKVCFSEVLFPSLRGLGEILANTHLTQNNPIFALAVHVQSQFSQLPNPTVQTPLGEAERVEAADNQVAVCCGVELLPHHRLFVQLIWQDFDGRVVKLVGGMFVVSASKEISVDSSPVINNLFRN